MSRARTEIAVAAMIVTLATVIVSVKWRALNRTRGPADVEWHVDTWASPSFEVSDPAYYDYGRSVSRSPIPAR